MKDFLMNIWVVFYMFFKTLFSKKAIIPISIFIISLFIYLPSTKTRGQFIGDYEDKIVFDLGAHKEKADINGHGFVQSNNKYKIEEAMVKIEVYERQYDENTNTYQEILMESKDYHYTHDNLSFNLSYFSSQKPAKINYIVSDVKVDNKIELISFIVLNICVVYLLLKSIVEDENINKKETI